MSDEEPRLTAEAVARFIALCREPEADEQPVWLETLRGARPEFSTVTAGRSWTIEIAMHGLCEQRIGITSTGRVICPLGPGGVADARIEGPPEAVAEFVLGGGSFERALRDRVLVLGSPSTSLGSLRHLRQVAARALGHLVAWPLIVVVVARRLAIRWHRYRAWATTDLGPVLERGVPAFVALLMVTAPVSAQPAGNEPAAAAAPIGGVVEARQLPATSTPSTSARPVAVSSRDYGPSPWARSDAQTEQSRTTAGEDTGSVGAVVRADAEPPMAQETVDLKPVSALAEIHCDGSMSGAVACAAVRAARAVTEP